MGHQQYSGNKLAVHPLPGSMGGATLKGEKMTAVKMAIMIANYLGWSGFMYIAFMNLDSWKGWMLTALAVIYGALRIYFYYIRENQAAQKRDLELRHLERQDKKEEENEE